MTFNRIRASLIFSSVLALVPSVIFAEEIDSLDNIARFLNLVQAILDIVIPLLVTAAVAVFFWGLVKYLYAAGDPKQREAGKGLMVWGVIALFVMISIWGITAVIGSLFGVDANAGVTIPTVPIP